MVEKESETGCRLGSNQARLVRRDRELHRFILPSVYTRPSGRKEENRKDKGVDAGRNNTSSQNAGKWIYRAAMRGNPKTIKRSGEKETDT